MSGADNAAAIHNAIGDFYFDEPDFDECGGRTFRRVRVPKSVVRNIVQAAISLHEARANERTDNG